ncbi:MAG: late competence development ComFB family protein [Oscillospiraceae bacterium]
MPRAKKTFDREEMYKKIMPSASKFQVENIDKEFGDDIENTLNQASTINSNAINSAIKNHSLIWMPDCDEKDSIVYNIVEHLVSSALDEVLRKMKNCCHCDRCKKDIIAVALNNLPAHYIVCTKENIENEIEKANLTSMDVTSAIMRAIITVKQSPRH